MGRVLAIARLTVVESVRKRVFVALAGFGAAMLGMVSLFPAVDPAAQVVLIQAWAYRLILLFGMMAAVMLGAFSIPEDIEERRIQTLLSKPVRRVEVMLGKYFGFLGVTFVFFLVMGLAGYATVRAVAALAGPAAEPSLTPDIAERAAAFRAKDEADQRTEWDVWSPSGRVEEYLRVAGPRQYRLEWGFSGVTREAYGDRVRARVRLFVGVVHPDPMRMEDTVPVTLEAWNPERPGESVGLPQRLWYGRADVLEFPASVAEPGGKVVLRFHRDREDTWLAGRPDSVELLRAGGTLSFEWNFAKGLFLVFLQVAIVLSIVLAVSLFTSAHVALLAGGFFFLCGNMVGFLRESLVTSRQHVVQRMGETAPRDDPGDLPVWLVDAANRLTENILGLLPDFSRLDYAKYLVTNTSVPLGDLFGGWWPAAYAAFLFGPLIAACLIAWRREFR